MYKVSDEQISQFQQNGVVFLPGVFKDWVEPLRQAVTQAMDSPSPLERSYKPKDGSAPFFQDLLTWKHIDPLRDFVLNSQAARVAAEIMNSRTARFFHDHILVKLPGTSLVTPWHQDQPYYSVRGSQSVSFWTPLDPVPQSWSACAARTAGMKRVSGRDASTEVGFIRMMTSQKCLISNRSVSIFRSRLIRLSPAMPLRSTSEPFMVRQATPRPIRDVLYLRVGWATTLAG
jgi:hypothetical protein